MPRRPFEYADRPRYLDDGHTSGIIDPMGRASGRLPPSTDALAETLHHLRVNGTLYCRAELSAPWAVDVPRLDGLVTFLVVTAGRCWLEVRGTPAKLLEKGAFALLPHGVPHRVRSKRDVRSVPLFDLPVEKISERYETMRYGGGGDVTLVTYGVLRFEHAVAERLVAALPPMLTFDPDAADTEWLDATVRLIAREASAMRPGGETVITRLADVLVVQAIRAWLDTAPEARSGWLAALRDPQLGQALAGIHRAPSEAWSLASLAKRASMSRSTFAARFTALVGDPPMNYVARWRMLLARDALRDTSDPVGAIAAKFGYASEAAFCRAFKRTFAVSPGAARRAR